jgi:acetyl-CoA carboxylase/biotin carboxylase 1
MHRNDPQLQALDLELEMTDAVDVETQDLLKEQIKAREAVLKPIYLQAATEFADLHDKTGRMEAKGVIRHAVPWERSREYFYYRATRRMLQDDYVKRLQKEGSKSFEVALQILADMAGDEQWNDDFAMIDFFTNEKGAILAKIKIVRDEKLKAQMAAIQEELDRDE